MRRLPITLLLLFPSVSFAEPMPLSYEDALQQTLDRNPELQGTAAILDQSSGALLAAEGIYDLQFTGRTGYSSNTSESIREFGEVLSEFAALDVNAGLTWIGQSGTSATVDMSAIRSRFKYELAGDIPLTIESEEPLYQTRLAVTVSQSLLRGHAKTYNLQALRQAQQAVDSATLAMEVQKQQSLADTANAYWNLWTARSLVRIAEESVGVTEEEQRLVHARVDLGQLAPVERSRVDAAVVQSHADLLEAQINADAAADVLRLLISLPLDTEMVLSTDPATPMNHSIDSETVQESALQGSQSLALLRLEEEGALADFEAARHALLPELTATSSYALLGYETSQFQALGEMFSMQLPEWSLGMNLSMPLGNRSARGNLATAQAVLTEKKINREALEASIRQQVSQQLRTLSNAQTRSKMAEQNLALAEETLEAERALRNAGRSLEKDVLEAMKALHDARIAVEQAKVDYLLAIIEIERLKGTL